MTHQETHQENFGGRPERREDERIDERKLDERGGEEEMRDLDTNKSGSFMQGREEKGVEHKEGHEGCDMCPSELADKEPGQS